MSKVINEVTSKVTGKEISNVVNGVTLGVVEAGIRKKNRKDLVVIRLAEKSRVAAVFTQNRFCAAPVTVAKAHLKKSSPKYLLINTGCANAGMGKQGIEDARASCAALAKIAGCKLTEVLPFSTGVIGERLPIDRLVAALPAVLLARKADNWEAAAQGIMTTDTREKLVSRQIKLDGKKVTITGIAKGAGMIKPNMATLLAYVATDANISEALLNTVLNEVVSVSFNRITVDGDTSTNDVCVLIATGQAGHAMIRSKTTVTYKKFRRAIEEIFLELAQAVIRDAEGATKFITLHVKGGKSSAECLNVAYAIAESPLVKTAFFACDPNWGRIVAVIGRSGISNLNPDLVKIHLNDVLIVEKGGRAKSYTESAGQRVMKETDIVITVSLARGRANETVWTSDLSHDYVKINAEYRS